VGEFVKATKGSWLLSSAVLVGSLLLFITILFASSVAAVAKTDDGNDVSGSWRYKTTVEVETPEGLKTGSAVREVTVQILHKGWNPETPLIKRSFRGEAVAVDLGKRGILFALLKGYAHGEDDRYYVVFDALGGPPGFTPQGIDYYSHLKNAKVTLTPTTYPVLVKFEDLRDPNTIKPVLEMESDATKKRFPIALSVKADHFEELFGKGVRLKAITLEMTNEPVTQTVKDILPAFGSIPRAFGHQDFIRNEKP
jgi:hypothetical protein